MVKEQRSEDGREGREQEGSKFGFGNYFVSRNKHEGIPTTRSLYESPKSFSNQQRPCRRNKPSTKRLRRWISVWLSSESSPTTITSRATDDRKEDEEQETRVEPSSMKSDIFALSLLMSDSSAKLRWAWPKRMLFIDLDRPMTISRLTETHGACLG